MKARRLLGIEQAAFNYETEPEEETTRKRSSPPASLELMRKRLFVKSSLAARKQQQQTSRRLLKKKLAARHQLLMLADRRKRNAGWEEAGMEELNVDSIEALVDNQPVEDENTNDSLVEVMMVGGGGQFGCSVCSETFPSRSGLEYHQRTRDHSQLKAVSCPKCDDR